MALPTPLTLNSISNKTDKSITTSNQHKKTFCPKFNRPTLFF